MGVMEARKKELETEERFAGLLLQLFEKHFQINNKEAMLEKCREGIHWWKTKNMYKRPLPLGNWKDIPYYQYRVKDYDFVEEERKATRMIVKYLCKQLGLTVPEAIGESKPVKNRDYLVLVEKGNTWENKERYGLINSGREKDNLMFYKYGGRKKKFEDIVISLRRNLKPYFKVSQPNVDKKNEKRIWLQYLPELDPEKRGCQHFVEFRNEIFYGVTEPEVPIHTTVELKTRISNRNLEIYFDTAGKRDAAIMLTAIEDNLGEGIRAVGKYVYSDGSSAEIKLNVPVSLQGVYKKDPYKIFEPLPSLPERNSKHWQAWREAVESLKPTFEIKTKTLHSIDFEICPIEPYALTALRSALNYAKPFIDAYASSGEIGYYRHLSRTWTGTLYIDIEHPEFKKLPEHERQMEYYTEIANACIWPEDTVSTVTPKTE